MSWEEGLGNTINLKKYCHVVMVGENKFFSPTVTMLLESILHTKLRVYYGALRVFVCLCLSLRVFVRLVCLRVSLSVFACLCASLCAFARLRVSLRVFGVSLCVAVFAFPFTVSTYRLPATRKN